MGALHRGHAALIERARKLVGPSGSVAVSIFVNPSQFGANEDYSRYPRVLSADRALCAGHGADLIFHPTPITMYPEGYSTWVNEEMTSLGLCGNSRPGHFRGVCTVVLKLLNILQPDIALFGLKDFQQYTVIERMAADLNLSVRIVPVETVREPDGLALSSRNRYLSHEERTQAPVLRKGLLAAKAAKKAGEARPATLKRIVLREIAKAPLARIDYVEVADASTLRPARPNSARTVIAAAVYFGETRLIDNILL